MIIRQEQIDKLSQVSQKGYVSSAVAHLERHDPRLAAAAGRPGLELVVRQGLVSARQYGFNTDRTVQLYLELMMSLGSGFDTDPQFRWLHPYLQPTENVGPMERARLLHFHATSYLHRAYGEDGEHARPALERAGLINLDRLRMLGADLDAQALTLLRWLQPQRVDFLDAEVLRTLVQGAREEAQLARLPLDPGSALLFLLKLTFGHRVLSDPLYPWLERQLRSAEPQSESERLERLFTRSQNYLKMMERALGAPPT